jgi:hypothetical protein
MQENNTQSADQELIPHLKKDAIVPVNIGTGFVQQLGITMAALAEGKTEQDMEHVQKLIDEKKELEPWMIGLITIQTLIKTVYEEGEKLGLVEHKSVDSSLLESLPVDPETQQS